MVVKFCTFIMKVSYSTCHNKAMSQSRSNPELPLVFFRQFYTVPLAKSRRTSSDIYRNVKDTSK